MAKDTVPDADTYYGYFRDCLREWQLKGPLADIALGQVMANDTHGLHAHKWRQPLADFDRFEVEHDWNEFGPQICKWLKEKHPEHPALPNFEMQGRTASLRYALQ
jgi:hypothetical protein